MCIYSLKIFWLARHMVSLNITRKVSKSGDRANLKICCSQNGNENLPSANRKIMSLLRRKIHIRKRKGKVFVALG